MQLSDVRDSCAKTVTRGDSDRDRGAIWPHREAPQWYDPLGRYIFAGINIYFDPY